MRKIVDEENIMKAVTLNGSLFQLVKVIGPLIGGSVAGIYIPPFFYRNECSFLHVICYRPASNSSETAER